MADDSGRYWITFNGEIYNFLELRDQLKKQGHHFTTRSDTETILAAYKQYGRKLCRSSAWHVCFCHLGLAENKSLFLARDRVGKKPLYYHFDGPALHLCFRNQGHSATSGHRAANRPFRSGRLSAATICTFPQNHLQEHPETAAGPFPCLAVSCRQFDLESAKILGSELRAGFLLVRKRLVRAAAGKTWLSRFASG